MANKKFKRTSYAPPLNWALGTTEGVLMSYVLHIWDEPLPKTFTEADEISDRLGRQPASGSINPKFAEAATRLTLKYPFNEDPEIESQDEVWSDGPLTQRVGERLWGVGILSQHAAEVQPFVVSTSNALGLVVYDFQLGKAYLPNGMVLSPASGPSRSVPSTTKPWWKLW